MASLRDVLNHAGKKVRVLTPGAAAREGLALRRGETVLVEPRLAPIIGDRIDWLDSGESQRVLLAEPQDHMGKVDHVRCKVASWPAG